MFFLLPLRALQAPHCATIKERGASPFITAGNKFNFQLSSKKKLQLKNKPSMPRKKRSRRESLDGISTFEGELNIPKKKVFLENLDIKAFFKILKEFTEEDNPVYEDVVSRILEVLPSTDVNFKRYTLTNLGIYSTLFHNERRRKKH
jgi:hypothetical protein